MVPEESPVQQPPGRQPFPRHNRVSVDGMSAQPVHRSSAFTPRNHVTTTAPELRPVYESAHPQSNVTTQPQYPVQSSPAPSQPVPPVSPAPATQITNNQPQSTPSPSPAPITKPTEQHTPAGSTSKKRHPVLMAGLVLLGLIIIAGSVFGWLRYQSIENNPDTIFQDALTSSLSTKQLQSNIVSGDSTTLVDYDFSSLNNPLVSSQSTEKLNGAYFQLAGYGSASNTYVSYAKFPSVITNNIVSVALNSWVQLRTNNVLPPGVSATLSNVADPRYLSFGPVVFGNIPQTIRTRLISYIKAQHIYSYHKADVHRSTLNGDKVFVYPITLNINYLKILNESVAASEKFNPGEVQSAVNNLNNYTGAKVILYISAKSHEIVEINLQQANQTTTINYADFNNISLPGEPETKLSWQDFAPLQVQIEVQAASHQSAMALDSERKADLAQLHSYLANYFAANNLYPTFINLDDPTWVAANMPGVDPDVFRDPLDTSLGLSPTPKAKNYSYQPLTVANKICDNNAASAVSQLCSQYSLTAILSNGQPYIVKNP